MKFPNLLSFSRVAFTSLQFFFLGINLEASCDQQTAEYGIGDNWSYTQYTITAIAQYAPDLQSVNVVWSFTTSSSGDRAGYDSANLLGFGGASLDSLTTYVYTGVTDSDSDSSSVTITEPFVLNAGSITFSYGYSEELFTITICPPDQPEEPCPEVVAWQNDYSESMLLWTADEIFLVPAGQVIPLPNQEAYWIRPGDLVPVYENGVKTYVARGAYYDASPLSELWENCDEINADDFLWDAETPASNSDFEGEGQAAGAAEADLIGNVPYNPSFTVPSSEPDFTIKLPNSMGGAEFDLNPFRSDRLGPMVAALREFIKWILLMGFASYLIKWIYDYVGDVNKVPQTRGHAAIGGTGAQATAAVSAAIITGAVLGGLGVVTNFLIGELGLQNLYLLSQTNPLFSIPSGVVWLIDQCLPLSLILSIFTARLLLPATATASLTLVAAIVRWAIA